MLRKGIVSKIFFSFLFFFFSGSLQAQFGFIKDVVKAGGKAVTDVTRTAGNVYQTATAPIRNTATTVYQNTLQQPVNQIRNGINSALPDDVRNFYKYEIQNRIEPFVNNYAEVMTGKTNIVDGTKAVADHSIALAKELAITPEIASLYYAARAASSPVPQEFLQVINKHWSSVTTRELHSSKAKYIVSNSLVKALTSLGNGNMAAITLYDVIIFREPLSMSASSLALLSHEMIHVAQYRHLGFSAFLATYISENLQNDYANTPKEVEAQNVQSAIYPKLSIDPTSTNNQFKLNNSSNIDYSNTLATNLAFFSTATNNPNEYASYMMAKVEAAHSIEDATAVMGYVLSTSGINSDTKAYGCRLMCTGPLSNNLSILERLKWAQAAAFYGPQSSINWYFLAAAAFQAQDAQTEYNALINLAGIMIYEETSKPMPNISRLSTAAYHLGRAIELTNLLNFQYAQFYDSRLAYVMLVELGLYLPVNYSKDIQLNQYAQTLANIDAARNVKDELHLRVIGALSGAHLYFCIANANFFAQYRTVNYLQEKRNRATACYNHAQWGLNEIQQFYFSLGNAHLYRNLFYNYQQQAASYNN